MLNGGTKNMKDKLIETLVCFSLDFISLLSINTVSLIAGFIIGYFTVFAMNFIL
jgi:hypothetical protein